LWAAAGLAGYAVLKLGRDLDGGLLAWDRAGRWAAVGVLAVAALYEFTPLKEACLRRCRGPLGFLIAEWRDGRGGALRMGLAHGAWCVGCCWALMAALFALGAMSLAWMIVIALLIAVEKMLPWHAVACAARRVYACRHLGTARIKEDSAGSDRVCRAVRGRRARRGRAGGGGGPVGGLHGRAPGLPGQPGPHGHAVPLHPHPAPER